MPNHSDQQLDDTIFNALKYDAVVSAAQKQRAWERLRNQVEARIESKSALADDDVDSVTSFLPADPALPVIAAYESDDYAASLTDAILETTPCCGGEIAEPERENILYTLMRRVTLGIGEGLESSARFLFWDDLALTSRPGCIPLHRRHIMMVGSFMVASA